MYLKLVFGDAPYAVSAQGITDLAPPSLSGVLWVAALPRDANPKRLSVATDGAARVTVLYNQEPGKVTVSLEATAGAGGEPVALDLQDDINSGVRVEGRAGIPIVASIVLSQFAPPIVFPNNIK